MRGRPKIQGITKKGLRDARLATIKGHKNIKQTQKSKALDKGNFDSSTSGKRGYAEKCKLQGVFLRVTISIKEYRMAHPNSTFSDVWEYLHELYPYIFVKTREQVYGSNVQKMIEAEPQWCEAYYCGKEDLIKMAEYRISKILENPNLKDTDLIKLYDTLKKYEAEQNADEYNDNDEITFTLGFRGQNE